MVLDLAFPLLNDGLLLLNFLLEELHIIVSLGHLVLELDNLFLEASPLVFQIVDLEGKGQCICFESRGFLGLFPKVIQPLL